MKGVMASVIGLTLLTFVVTLYFSPLQHEQVPANTIYSNTLLSKNTLDGIIASPSLTDLTSRWAANVGHRQSSKFITDFTETLGAGVCVNDVNNDGWLDLLVVGGGGYSRHYGKKAWWHQLSGNQLLLNQQGNFFKQADASWGLQDRLSGVACGFADLDNDGDDDLVLTGIDGIHIYQKDTLTFTKQSVDVLSAKQGLATSASFADFNRDGLLDIYITQFVKYKKGAKTFEPNRGFSGSASAPFSPQLFDSDVNLLLVNQGNFRFVESAKALGVDNNFGRSLGAYWHDLNKDSWLDLIVINSFETPMQVFLNNSGQSFSRANEQYSTLQLPHARSLSFIDTQNTTQLIAIPRAMGHTTTVLKEDTKTNLFKDVSDMSQFRRNNSQMKNAWGSVAADFNNDGWQDLVMLNGMLSPSADSKFLSQAQTDDIYWGAQNNRFIHASLDEPKQLPYSSRGAIKADLNNDGKIELIIANNNDDIRIMGFETPNIGNWISIEIINTHTDSNWQFAKVSIDASSSHQARRFDFAQTLFSQGDRRIHFGLQETSVVDSLTITSATGEQLNFTQLAANKHYVFNAMNKSLSIKAAQHYDNASQHLSTLLPDIKPDTSNLFELLISSESPNLYDLRTVWYAATEEQKIHYIKHLKKFFALEYLGFLEDALNSSEQALQATAIEAFKQLELEQSVRLLTPLLFAENTAIPCQVAKVFQFFFEEEEAVLFRKQLAVVPLLKALPNAPKELQQCILHALAAAENKRSALAMLPLVDSSDNALSVTAIQALGQVRDGRAVPKLTALLTQTTDPKKIANLLIALEKLSYTGVNTYLTTYFGEASTLSKVTQINTLSYLFASKQEVVLNKYGLIDIANKYLSVTSINKLNRTEQIALANMIVSTKFYARLSIETMQLLAKKISDTEESLALYLMTANAQQLKATVNSLPALIHALRLLRSKALELPSDQLFDLVPVVWHLTDRLKDHQSIIAELPEDAAERYIAGLITKLPEQEQVVLMRYATNLGLTPLPMVIESLIKSDAHRAEALAWYFLATKQTTSDLGIRLALNKVMKQNGAESQHADLLVNAASVDPIIFSTYKQKFPKILNTNILLDLAHQYDGRNSALPKEISLFVEQAADDFNLSLAQRIRAAALVNNNSLKQRLVMKQL